MNQATAIIAIDNWLAGKKSPMTGYADYMVILARQWGVAISLSVAIAQAEGQCGTDPNYDQVALAGFNAWGYGHSPGTHGHLFSSWPDGIASVSEYLGQLVHGELAFGPLTTVEKLGPVWVEGNAEAPPPTQWIDAVSAIVVKFGGDPEKLARAPLARAS